MLAMEIDVLHLANPVTRRFRGRHLHNAVPDAGPALAIDRLFDEFFELEWIFDHRHGASGALLASVAAALLDRRGWHARVVGCQCEVKKGGRAFHLGVRDWAASEPGRGHAVCVVEDRLIVDFALADVRRTFERGFPWGIATPIVRVGDGLASLPIAGHGRVRWSGEAPALAAADAMKVATLLPRLLLDHAQAFGDGAT